MDRETTDLSVAIRQIIADHLDLENPAVLDRPMETFDSLGGEYLDFSEIVCKIKAKTGLAIDDAHPALAAGYATPIAAFIAHILMLKAIQ